MHPVMLQALAAERIKDISAAADTAARAAGTAGRPLAAANADLPWPGQPHLVLWHAINVLREHRGDGHIAAPGAGW